MKLAVTLPSVGLWERVSVGEREISPEEADVRERWGGGAKGVRWPQWKIMWKNSRNSGMRPSKMTVHTMTKMLSVTFPSSILAKRRRLRRKETPKRLPGKMIRWGRLSVMRSLAVRVVVEREAMTTLMNMMMSRKMQTET